MKSVKYAESWKSILNSQIKVMSLPLYCACGLTTFCMGGTICGLKICEKHHFRGIDCPMCQTEKWATQKTEIERLRAIIRKYVERHRDHKWTELPTVKDFEAVLNYQNPLP